MNGTAYRAQRVTGRFAVAVAIAACGFGFGTPDAHAQTVAEAAPPTIEKVIVGDKGVANIEGEGKPGDVVLLMSGGAALGEAAVSANGRWRVALKDGLKPGTHQIRAEARAAPMGLVASGDEIRIAIPSETGEQAVVAYDGVTGDPERATRRRAEELAQAAGEAFDDVTRRAASPEADAAPQPGKDQAAPEREGPVAVVIEWLKRSARGYREEVVSKLGVGASEPAPAEPAATSQDRARDATAADAAQTIVKERAAAEARRIDLAEADTVRRAREAQAAEDKARKAEAAKRKQAEEIARRKAEFDRKIADDMERLKKAREEADRAKAARVPNQQKAAITLERFYLPGEKKPKRDGTSQVEERVVEATDQDDAAEKPSRRSSMSERCAEGRVITRKGRRWYVTGADDTLWDIAERFYGSGTAYPRIYKVNRKRMSSPHIVRPCLALRLPGRRG
jgi:nucleoid-associated protein YgaU